jgi:hypothetical protein
MSDRQRINNKSNTNFSQNFSHSQNLKTQGGMNSNKGSSEQNVENQQYEQDSFETSKLEIQAKFGIIKPKGQERLTFLQAKKGDHWQRYLGNVGRFSQEFSNISDTQTNNVPPVQAKLTIGKPEDKYEQEADTTARQIVQRINHPQNDNLQRKEVLDDELQTKSLSNVQCEASAKQLQTKFMIQHMADGGIASPDLESGIQQARGSGQKLAGNIREPMEQAFGVDFSGVKVHTDARSDQLNRSINAKAFTTGQDVFFRQGAYQPNNRGGQELLAHELTHVVQQGKDKVSLKVENGVEISSGAQQIQRSGEALGNGIAELYEPDAPTTTACFFGHGVYNNDISEIDGVTLGYYCPHQSALNSNISMIEHATLYDASVHDDQGKWHNYTLTSAHVKLSDQEAKSLCNTNDSALALIQDATSTAAIVQALKAKGYTTLKAIHCREVYGMDNKEWDPITNAEVQVAPVTQTVTKISLKDKWDFDANALIDDNTDIQAGFIYMDKEGDYTTCKQVVAVNGANLEVKSL